MYNVLHHALPLTIRSTRNVATALLHCDDTAGLLIPAEGGSCAPSSPLLREGIVASGTRVAAIASRMMSHDALSYNMIW